jgi:hypothetical protein
MINETYSAFVQGFMPTLARPDVDVLEGLTTAIIVGRQRPFAGRHRYDANALLTILFSRLGEPHIGPPTAYLPAARRSRARRFGDGYWGWRDLLDRCTPAQERRKHARNRSTEPNYEMELIE